LPLGVVEVGVGRTIGGRGGEGEEFEGARPEGALRLDCGEEVAGGGVV
jgi:hypothetical protein